MNNVEMLAKNDPINDVWRNNYIKNIGLFQFCKNIMEIDKSNYHQVVCLVGAGSSIDKNLSILKENEDKMIIIATDAAYPALKKHGIIPNFICICDPSPIILTYVKSDVVNKIGLICPTTTDNSILNYWLENKGEVYLFAETDPNIKFKKSYLKKLNRDNSFTVLEQRGFVGYTAIQVAEIIQAYKIILLGYDFCFENNRIYNEELLKLKFGADWEDENKVVLNRMENLKQINPNRSTNGLYYLYYMMFTKFLKSDTKNKMINCSSSFYNSFLTYVEFSHLISFLNKGGV